MKVNNDFTKGSIVHNIMNLAIPMTLAQIINVLYNIVDRIYIGRIPEIGTVSMTGIGVTLPIITMITAFANLFGTGGAPLFSIARGRGNDEEAENIMATSFRLLLSSSLVLTIIFLIFKRPILYLFGASDITFPYADSYITLYLLGTIFVMVGLGMNSYINAQGFGKIGMTTVLLGAVANIILDPIFIFLFDMGVQGAALATILSQFLSALWIVRFLTGRKTLLKLRIKNCRLQWHRVSKIILMGMSGFVMALTNSLVQTMCNAGLYRYGGDLYVGVMTVINSIREVIVMPITGLTNAAQPVIGYNYGAKAYSRVRASIKFMSIVCIAYSMITWIILHSFPGFFVRIFNNNTDLIQASLPALRIYFFGFFMMAFQFAGQTVFVALGRSKHAIFFSLLRKAIIVVPLTLLLPQMFGLGTDGIFLAEPISNFIGGLACYVTMIITIWPKLKQEDN